MVEASFLLTGVGGTDKQSGKAKLNHMVLDEGPDSSVTPFRVMHMQMDIQRNHYGCMCTSGQICTCMPWLCMLRESKSSDTSVAASERSKCRTECGPEEGGWLWAQRTFSAQVWYDPQPLDVDQPRVQESL